MEPATAAKISFQLPLAYLSSAVGTRTRLVHFLRFEYFYPSNTESSWHTLLTGR